ncbi:MAG: hypothetical protein C0608_02140 [Deltaproteobacteria bacterium]|nr:MAG: hypothetical protein C0608_02140 [Deltaproteobacteria bacterium]
MQIKIYKRLSTNEIPKGSIRGTIDPEAYNVQNTRSTNYLSQALLITKGQSLVFADFIKSFTLIFLAEMGDKTQIILMLLAARHHWSGVFGGAASAFTLLGVIAVAAGQLLYAYLDPRWVGVAAAILFAVLGVMALRASDDDDESGTIKGRSVFWGVFALIFIAELGDKTQLATVSLAATLSNSTGVFLGATLALWAVSILGIFFGATIMRRIPERIVKRIAGILFLLFAAITIVHVFSNGS